MTLAELTEIAQRWLADPESGVVGIDISRSGWVGVRFAQTVRDFTTVWFAVGELTVAYEAYLSPPPRVNGERVYELCLKRNASFWLAHIAIDRHGDLVVRGQFPIADADEDKLDDVLGVVYELVELTFRPLIRIGFERSSEGT